MFVKSANNLLENSLNEARRILSSMDDKTFNRFLSEKYPKCAKHYQERRKQFNTTWDFERANLIGIFEFTNDNPGELDYIIGHINPEPRQIIGFEDVKRGSESLNGTSILDKIEWLAKNRWDAYKR